MKSLNFDEKLDAVPDEVIAAFKAEKFDECLSACEKILSQNPTNKIALIYCGIINQERNEDEKALAYFNAVTEAMPNFRYAWQYKGISHLKRKECDEAKEAFMSALDLYKGDAANWCFLARSAYMKGTEDGKAAAFYVLDHCLDMVDNKSMIPLAKGILEQDDGRDQDALISYMQSQILAPENEKDVSAEKIGRLLK